MAASEIPGGLHRGVSTCRRIFFIYANGGEEHRGRVEKASRGKKLPAVDAEAHPIMGAAKQIRRCSARQVVLLISTEVHLRLQVTPDTVATRNWY